MKIAICEDNDADRELLYAMVEECLQSHGLEAVIFSYLDGEELLAAAKTHYFSILFLDILLPGTSGVDVALQLRKDGSRAGVVFTTMTSDYLADSYRVWAVHYLMKPLEIKSVQEAFSRALAVLVTEEKMLEICVARHREFIPYADIRYVHADARISAVHTRTGVYRPYENLQEMFARLADPRFVYCHRSYIVNLDFVVGVQREHYVIDNDILIPIRREDRTQARKLFEQYTFEKLRRRP